MKHSRSQRVLRLKSLYTKLSLKNPNKSSNRHPSSFLVLNFANNIKSSHDKLGFFSTTYYDSELQRRKLYDNIHIFHKRQYAFNKSIEANKKVFKYTNFSLFNEKNKTSRNKKFLGSKKIDSNIIIDYSKFFLTDNGSILPILNSKSITNDIIKKHNSIINTQKKRNRIFDKINYIMKNQSTPKIRRNNIRKKLNIFTNIKNSELNPSIYINELKNFLIDKLNFITKAEKLRTLNENNQEKIEQINIKIDNLKKNYSHFENIFCHKFNEYIREIHNAKEEEKEKDYIYVDNLIKLKSKVNNLKTSVKKIEINKNSFNHWMYLQIRMKEKKLHLPQSYKDILESNYYEKDSLIKKYGEDLFNHVKQYKNAIIYKTAEEFLNQFDLYENKNLKLLNKYHIIREQIRELENEKDDIKSIYNFEEFENEFKDLYNSKLKELERLKNENSHLVNYIDSLISKKNKSLNNDNNVIKKRSKLYYKTQRILSNINKCCNFSFENHFNINKAMSENQLILKNLSQIEKIIDILIKKNESLKELYPDKMNNLKLILDKEKKNLKNLETINNIKMKFEEERKKIFKKYEKIFVLPTHKLNIYNIRNKKDINTFGNNTKTSKSKNKTIEDIDNYINN